MRVATILALVLMLAAPLAQAGESISGLWEEASTPGHKNSFVVFSQDDAKVWVTCYWEFKGQKVVWHGSGTREGNQVNYQITHTRYPKGFEKRGQHKLTLSQDGKTMTGTWYDTRQNSGPLKFERRK